MKRNILSPVLICSLIGSMAGCAYYFKEQFALYSVKAEQLSGIKLEKEQTFRIARAQPLRIFRPPRVVPDFAVFAAAALKATLQISSSSVELRKKPVPESIREDAKKVDAIELLASNYIKDAYLLGEMAAFSHVSTTLTARLLAVYNALMTYDKPSLNSLQLKDTVKMALIENSETTYFEIMITFEDTLSAFPDVAILFLSLVEELNVTQEQKVAYFSAYLNRKLSQRKTAMDEERDQSIALALEKLRRQGIDESRIKKIVDNFIDQNGDNPHQRRQALLLSNTYRPEPTDGEWLESDSGE
jgi:hypothetical protein